MRTGTTTTIRRGVRAVLAGAAALTCLAPALTETPRPGSAPGPVRGPAPAPVRGPAPGPAIEERFDPGRRIDPAAAAALGDAGRELAKHLGRDPVLLVFWRPQDEASEAALVDAADAASKAKGVTLFPVAVLAARQPHEQIGARLEHLGLALPGRHDDGPLPIALGLQQVPGFALVDASGVLRASGGRKLAQPGLDGTTLAEALRRAARREPVPTLGVLPQQPVYEAIGKKLPDAVLAPLDGAAPLPVRSCVPAGERAIFVAWLPNCPHCKKLLADIGSWCASQGDGAPAVVGITRTDSPAQREAALAVSAKLPFRTLLDNERAFFRELRVSLVPTVLLVEADGTIARVHVGGDLDLSSWLGKTGRKKPA